MYSKHDGYNKNLKKRRVNLPESDGIYLEDYYMLISDNGKIRVLSRKCTHLGCKIVHFDNKFLCPCHGSEFDLNGKVMKGPAEKNLSLLDFTIKSDSTIEMIFDE
jgi:cytochrome b6-f complex iron-sulfur subunit